MLIKIDIAKTTPSRLPASLLLLTFFDIQTVASFSTFPYLRSNDVRGNGKVDVHIFGVNLVGGKVQNFALCHEGDE